jgi:hypothetical protein
MSVGSLYRAENAESLMNVRASVCSLQVSSQAIVIVHR